MKKTKRLIEQAILLAVDSITTDIQSTTDEGRNLERAKAVKILAEAYNLVERGK